MANLFDRLTKVLKDACDMFVKSIGCDLDWFCNMGLTIEILRIPYEKVPENSNSDC